MAYAHIKKAGFLAHLRVGVLAHSYFPSCTLLLLEIHSSTRREWSSIFVINARLKQGGSTARHPKI